MIFTSYYANMKNIEGNVASISNTQPYGINIHQVNEFVPNTKLVKSYKDGNIDEKEYNKLYMLQLNLLHNSKQLLQKIDNTTLFCYEKPTDFCHRIILRKWLAKIGKFALEYKQKYNIAIVGSREYDNEEEFFTILTSLIKGFKSKQTISFTSGGADGADTLAKEFAIQNNIQIDEYLPEWDKHGKKAGFIRNSKIWENADFGLAFWDGKSKGTRHSLSIAKNTYKTLIIYNYKEKKFFTYNWEKLLPDNIDKRNNQNKHPKKQMSLFQ